MNTSNTQTTSSTKSASPMASAPRRTVTFGKLSTLSSENRLTESEKASYWYGKQELAAAYDADVQQFRMMNRSGVLNDICCFRGLEHILLNQDKKKHVAAYIKKILDARVKLDQCGIEGPQEIKAQAIRKFSRELTKEDRNRGVVLGLEDAADVMLELAQARQNGSKLRSFDSSDSLDPPRAQLDSNTAPRRIKRTRSAPSNPVPRRISRTHSAPARIVNRTHSGLKKFAKQASFGVPLPRFSRASSSKRQGCTALSA
jgi:hypothetical protein